MTGDTENNFLGDGITTNIIATLNKSERFEVPPSSTAKYIQKKELPNTEVREKYGIEFIVTGNIQGNADKLRVTAEMMDVAKNNEYKALFGEQASEILSRYEHRHDHIHTDEGEIKKN